MTVHVMQAAEMFEQSITVIGAVTRPGKYQWQARAAYNRYLSLI